jgi:hypothetical protein
VDCGGAGDRGGDRGNSPGAIHRRLERHLSHAASRRGLLHPAPDRAFAHRHPHAQSQTAPATPSDEKTGGPGTIDGARRTAETGGNTKPAARSKTSRQPGGAPIPKPHPIAHPVAAAKPAPAPDLPQWPLGVAALLGGAAGWALWRRKSPGVIPVDEPAPPPVVAAPLPHLRRPNLSPN